MSAGAVAVEEVKERTGERLRVIEGWQGTAATVGVLALYVAVCPAPRVAFAFALLGASTLICMSLRTAVTGINAFTVLRPSRILCSLSPALVALPLAALIGSNNVERLALAVVAVAVADEFATSFGSLSRGAILLSNGQSMPVGTDGAVTFPGTLAFQGAAAGFALACGLLSPQDQVSTFLQLFLVGSVGCIVDTYLGATLQRRGLFSNDQVDLVAACFAALLMGSFIALR